MKLRESDGTRGSAAAGVNDGPQSAVGLGDQADAAARKNASQGDGTAIVGRSVLDGALEGGGGAVHNGKAVAMVSRWIETLSVIFDQTYPCRLQVPVWRVARSRFSALGSRLISTVATSARYSAETSVRSASIVATVG